MSTAHARCADAQNYANKRGAATNNPFEQAERQQEARQSDDEQQKSDNREINNHPNGNVQTRRSFRNSLPIQGPVLNRLGYVWSFYVFLTRKIGNGPSDFENAGIARVLRSRRDMACSSNFSPGASS